jgi:hypothetical protein
MFGKRIMRALGFAALMTMGFANAQTCTPTSPRLDSGATFAAFNELERLEVRGGKAGTADWEWGVGKNTQTTGQFASGNLDWVSGRTLDWTLIYGSNGSATLTVKNGTSQTLSLSYATAPNGMRSGNALKFYAKTTADAGEAKVYVVPKSINGKEITGELETKGNGTLSEKSLFYYFPAMTAGFTAKGTVKFTFEGTAPPQGSRMSFLVTAGNITCGTTTDTTAPTITGQAPNSLKLNTATPVISAQYADVGTGIDTTKITLLVDGTNVTAQATVSATGVTYTPSTALTNGAHTVQLNVADKANNPAQASWSFTVDTQLPTISGQSPNNIAINTAKPTIAAQYADMGTGIDLTKTALTIDGATVTGQTTATGISYVPATALAAGTHNITLKVFDQAGNTTQSAWSFSVDVVGPVISALVPANAATISNNRPAISAQYADAGAGVDTTKTVFTVDGVNVTAQATATATGISYTPATALASGARTVVLKVFDKAGNTSQSTWTFTVSAVVTDTTPPTISGQAPNGLNLNSATPVISAQYADTGTGVDTTKVTLLVDGTNVTAQATVSTTGVTYTPATALANGNHTVQLNIADKANNPAQATWSFTVDTQVPTISGQSPNNTSVNTATPTIAAQYADVGTGIDLTKTAFTVDGVNVTAQANATATGISYTPAVALAAGAHTISLKVFDQAGNSTQATWTFSVDIAGPFISALAPANAAIINNTQPTISAQYADQGGGIDTTKTLLTVDGVNVTAQAAATASGISYMLTAPLTSGAHTVVLKVFDKAGNSSQSSWSFSIDNGAPIITSQTPKDVSINNAKPTIFAQYADSRAGVDITKTMLTVDGADVTAKAQVTAAGINYTPTTALANGAHTVVLKVADNAGNPAQTTWSFSIDTQGPAVTNLQPNNVIVGGVIPPTISAKFADAGAGIDISTVVLLVDGVNVTAQSQVTATGISYSPTAQLAGGQHSVQLTLSDLAGNGSQATATFTVDVSSPAITGQAPYNVTVGATPISVVSAQFSDQGAGIDASKVTLTVDSLNVTGQAQITATGITFTASTAYASGVHNVTLKVSDLTGNEATSAWSFTTDADGPTISGQSPIDVSLPADALPTITAKFADGGQGGVNTSSIKLIVDGADVTSNATVANGQISYTPTEALVEGNHAIQLTVADASGNATTVNWQFKTASAPLISDQSPINITVPTDTPPLIAASFVDQGSTGIDLQSIKLSVDGVDVTTRATITSSSISYPLPLPLVEGVHRIVLVVPDRLGNAANASWQFSTGTPPSIFDALPIYSNLPSGSSPIISASYSDDESGINPASVRLTLDGLDVTAQATVSQAGVSYTSLQSLVDGAHVVSLSVADNAGNLGEATWTFSTNSLPQITSLSPSDGGILRSGSAVVVSAKYIDALRGIDRNSVRLIFDGVDVTGTSQVATDKVTFNPALPLAEGPHTVYLLVANGANKTAQAAWSFSVERATTYNAVVLSPTSGSTVFAPKVSILASGGANKSSLQSVKIGDTALTFKSIDASGATTFSGEATLIAGTNTIRAVFEYSDGQMRTATANVIYDAPPIITITSPTDLTTLGAVNPNSPRDLTGNVERPITISGTVSKPISGVTVNQQQAVVNGQSFTFSNFYLREGTNLLTIAATDNGGRIATSSITVFVDQTAPLISIEAPTKDAVTSNNKVDVRGIVNDAVEGIVNAPNPSVTVTNTANNQSITAKVSDRFYIAEDVPLEVGTNRLRVIATDHVGNFREQTLQVNRVATGSNRLTVLAGNRQAGSIKAQLAKPLEIAALDKDGNPLANLPVTFDILRGTGSLSAQVGGGASNASATRNLIVNTDAGGRAKVFLTLGKQAGDAGNMVRASNVNANEEVVFTATAVKGVPAYVRAADGSSQYASTSSPVLEALTAVVVDADDNRVANVAVTFTVSEGDATFENGQRNVTVNTDRNGFAATRPTMGITAGKVRIIAAVAGSAVSLTNVAGAAYQVTVLAQQESPTRFTGKVLDHTGAPLPGVRVSIGRTSLIVATDNDGNFTFADQVPPGRIDLFIDGRTATANNKQYPSLHFEALSVRGQNNILPHAIHLPPLLSGQAKVVGGNKDVSLTIPGFEGFEMIVRANSVTFPDGSKTGPLVISPVLLDKLPMVPPGGYAGFMAPAWTIQPSGTRFDPPIEVKIPNSLNLKPGEGREIYQWDHDLATFVPMGRATVSEDGALLVSDTGSGITKAGWGGAPNPNPPVPPKCAEPRKPKPELCEESYTDASGCVQTRVADPKFKVRLSSHADISDRDPPSPPESGIKSAIVQKGASKFEVYGTKDNPSVGDLEKIKWKVTSGSAKATGIKDADPSGLEGSMLSFNIDNVRNKTGDASNQSQAITVTIEGTMCEKNSSVTIFQDEKDVIRQEYADFKDEPVMHTKSKQNRAFTLAPPDRSEFQAKGTYVGATNNLTNPYTISLGDPFGLANSVAASYNIKVKTASVQKLQVELAKAQAANNATQVQQIQLSINQVNGGTYYPLLNSVWRSPRHNYSVDGAANSNHLTGAAADLKPDLSNIPPKVTSMDAWCLLREAGGEVGTAGQVFLETNVAGGVNHSDTPCRTVGISQNHVHVGRP